MTHYSMIRLSVAALILTACSAESAKSEVMTVTVGPDKVDCVGVAPMKCLVVDGENFYDPIDGFEHVAGTAYVLKIERTARFGDKPVPADAGAYAYELLEIVDATPQ